MQRIPKLSQLWLRSLPQINSTELALMAASSESHDHHDSHHGSSNASVVANPEFACPAPDTGNATVAAQVAYKSSTISK